MDIHLAEVDIVRERLAHDADRRRKAHIARDYYRLRNKDHLPRYAGESETDFASRPKRFLGLVYAAIRALAGHLYNPGPIRTWPNQAAQAALDAVYKSNQINARAAQADSLAILHGASAIGLTVGERPERPVRLDVFGGDEITVWTEDDDPEEPYAVAAVACSKGRETYTLWTADERRVYLSVDGQRPEKTEEGPNPFGRLPFAFLHAQVPVSTFWDGGIGQFLADVNMSVDDELSSIAYQSRYAVPIGVAEGSEPPGQVVIRPGYFNHFLAGQFNQPTKLGYTQAQYDAINRIEALEAYVYMALESIGIPRSAIRMDQSDMSGIAIVAEQLPLRTMALQRQPLADIWEHDLARLILLALSRLGLASSPAPIEQLATSWSDPPLPIPMRERDDQASWEIEQGLTSAVMECQRRFNLTRDEAMARLRQVSEDQQAIRQMSEEPVPRPGPTPSPLDEASDPEIEE